MEKKKKQRGITGYIVLAIISLFLIISFIYLSFLSSSEEDAEEYYEYKEVSNEEPVGNQGTTKNNVSSMISGFEGMNDTIVFVFFCIVMLVIITTLMRFLGFRGGLL